MRNKGLFELFPMPIVPLSPLLPPCKVVLQVLSNLPGLTVLVRVGRLLGSFSQVYSIYIRLRVYVVCLFYTFVLEPGV
jgi:hypothetical protein